VAEGRKRCPPPIDNWPVVEKKKKKKEADSKHSSSSTWNRLKPNLVKDDDYVILNAKVIA
tara:strand:- start:551 stop:730 length:180 start_codon:yes stop_codon:yes gene_type:complete